MQTRFKKLCLMLLCAQMSFAYADSSIESDTDTIHLMTFNIACLPSPLGIQMNADFLRPNTERAQQIVKEVNLLDANSMPNVIAFEEAFDPNVRNLLQQQLAARYPYNSGALGEKKLNAGSGLLFFSQYPILSMEFHPYTNTMVGDETLANKGFLTVKLKYNNQYFFTVIVTHLSSGDAVKAKAQANEATTSFRRGEQMGRMYAEIQTKASVSPAGYENLQYLKTFVLGDFNMPLNNEREQKSISTGFSDNGYKEGQIKYPGQYWLFSILQNSVPNNFMEVRVLPTEHGAHKLVDPTLLDQAVQNHKFIGSTIPVDILRANKNHGLIIQRQSAEYHIIDGLFASIDGIKGTLQTHLVSFNETSNYQYEMSDHYVLMGKFSFTSKNI